ncbi:MAG TPA: thiamine phosphate synthase [Acidimicrobiales bacterium]|nr:thiamine phosphate synthase [Acidimicrobiales bacterium]
MSAPDAERPDGARGPLAGRRLYLCTPDRPDLARFVASCVKGGVDVVQLREKTLDARPLLRRAALLSAVCADLGVPFILNDRPDLALECGADGVHVGQDDAPPSLARRILGPFAVVGLSTHAPEELDRSDLEPVDYLSAGPVVETPTKPGRPGTGIGYAALAVARGGALGRPVFVTGGVTPATVPGLAAAGLRHFVVVRWLTEASDPEAAARELRGALDRAIDLARKGGPGQR